MRLSHADANEKINTNLNDNYDEVDPFNLSEETSKG